MMLALAILGILPHLPNPVPGSWQSDMGRKSRVKSKRRPEPIDATRAHSLNSFSLAIIMEYQLYTYLHTRCFGNIPRGISWVCLADPMKLQTEFADR
ncbi:hypothetical protein TWF751_010545 [Orbilia oligospora]|nr:hypothetical protein TWF751_010545 [Orbilia oligospora]